MIAAILAFFGPFLPDLIGLGRSWMDHKQELEMMALRGKLAEKEADWRLQEIETTARIEDVKSARKPHSSYGVKLLNAASKSDTKLIWRWSFNIVFLAFAALDWFISSVRPGVSYYVFGLYGAVKAAKLWVVFHAVESVNGGDDVFSNIAQTLLNESAWTQTDVELLAMIAAFHFGDRIARRARGDV